jgi:hypothetical protein
VAHACNPSHSGGRDQEDLSLKPAQANSLQVPTQKNPSQKRTGRVAQNVDHEFKPQYCKKTKAKTTTTKNPATTTTTKHPS